MVNNLRELLDMRGLSISAFARYTGISQPTMHRIVNGQVNIEAISVENFMRIAHGLGLSAEELYFGDTSYNWGKRTIDRVYATTCNEGRHAMVANALGVSRVYSPNVGCLLPEYTDDIETIKGL